MEEIAFDVIELEVDSIELVENEDVYDITTERNHNFFVNDVLVHNCGEVTLADHECCNLSEIFLNNIETEEELQDVSILLYKLQKAVCAMPFIHKETTEIVSKNMRIGQAVGGICQSISKLKWLDSAYKNLKKVDKVWSKLNGWPTSIKLTTVKPSGTLSLLAGSTPGTHPGFSWFFIRRVRMASTDKLVQVCRELGYHIEYVKNFDGTEDKGTVVVSFPCRFSEDTIIAKNMKAVDQLELVKQIQTIWSDNSVSVTVYYKKEEVPEIKEWLKQNYENSVKSVSFLLHSDHGFSQAPYEEITEARYKELKKKIKPFVINKNLGSELFDGLECENGVCPIK